MSWAKKILAVLRALRDIHKSTFIHGNEVDFLKIRMGMLNIVRAKMMTEMMMMMAVMTRRTIFLCDPEQPPTVASG